MKKHIPTFEDFLNESSTINEGEVDPRVKGGAVERLADFFRINVHKLLPFKFDGNDNIKELTKVLNSTSDEGTELYYKTAIKLAKEEAGIHESEVNESKKDTFVATTLVEIAAEYTDVDLTSNMTQAKAVSDQKELATFFGDLCDEMKGEMSSSDYKKFYDDATKYILKSGIKL